MKKTIFILTLILTVFISSSIINDETAVQSSSKTLCTGTGYSVAYTIR